MSFEEREISKAEIASFCRSERESYEEPGYQFPEIDISKHQSQDHAALRFRLEGLTNRRRFPIYASVRQELCEIGMELNRRGLQPPGFRPYRSLPKKGESPYTPTDILVLRDRMMVDVDWLALHVMRGRKLDDDNYYSLFTRPDAELRHAFVSEGWVASKRAALMKLSDTEQLQTTSFRDDAARGRWRYSNREQFRETAAAIHAHANEQKDVTLDGDVLEALYTATKLAGRADRRAIARLYGWLTASAEQSFDSLLPNLKQLNQIVQARRKPQGDSKGTLPISSK